MKFSSDSHRTGIKATCAGGQPQFTVEEDDRGDNSGPGATAAVPGGRQRFQGRRRQRLRGDGSGSSDGDG